MKRILAMVLALCLCIGLCACGMSMDKLKDNLGSSYKKVRLDDEDLEAYADLLGLDVDDYDIESAIQATHKKKGIGVVIIECGSKKEAEELADDGEGMVDYLSEYYGTNYSFDMVVKGKFILCGEERAIKAALEK